MCCDVNKFGRRHSTKDVNSKYKQTVVPVSPLPCADHVTLYKLLSGPEAPFSYMKNGETAPMSKRDKTQRTTLIP